MLMESFNYSKLQDPGGEIHLIIRDLKPKEVERLLRLATKRGRLDNTWKD